MFEEIFINIEAYVGGFFEGVFTFIGTIFGF